MNQILHRWAPPGAGPPPHRHAREDELFYVLDGEFAFVADDQVVRGSRGFTAYLPKRSLHTYKNVGDTPGRFLVIATPCGFESFVAEAAGGECKDPSAPPPPVEQPAIERLMAACGKYGLELFPDHKAETPAPPRDPGRELWVLGNHITIKETARDTGGNFTVAEITSPPGAGVPPHLHHVEDEIFYVAEGTWAFTLGDGPNGEPHDVTAMPGSLIRVPKGTMHGFGNIGTGPGRLVDFHTPGGFERFFEEAGVECTDAAAGPPTGGIDMVKMMNCIRRHGMEMPPPAGG